jgi:hypothetical protein
LVIGSDLLAAGVLQVLYERRLRVPDDLSVVSFDDTLGPYMVPALTESKPLMKRWGVKPSISSCSIRNAKLTAANASSFSPSYIDATPPAR